MIFATFYLLVMPQDNTLNSKWSKSVFPCCYFSVERNFFCMREQTCSIEKQNEDGRGDGWKGKGVTPCDKCPVTNLKILSNIFSWIKQMCLVDDRAEGTDFFYFWIPSPPPTCLFVWSFAHWSKWRERVKKKSNAFRLAPRFVPAPPYPFAKSGDDMLFSF